eukprot:10648168-Alexandrium_andersonii.AAC.1
MKSQSVMLGVRGSTLWGAKNIARFQREAGEFLRLLMAVIEALLPQTRFSAIHWEFDALEIGDQWAAAILPTDGTGKARNKTV